MSGIKLSTVSYHYQKQAVFQNLSLEIAKQRITCLVGPNGSGKSTLLKLLVGLLIPSTGIVTLDSRDLTTYSRKAIAKKIAYLPQQSRIPPHLTVHEYVALSRFCHQSWFSGLKEHDYISIEQAIALTNLHAFADQPVLDLSAGQQQRARIALMLAQQAEYLLLDEPMTGLDLKQQYHMLELFINLQKKYDKTIVVILHDLHHMMKIAEEVILLKNGCLLYQGHPKETLNTNLLLNTFDYPIEILHTIKNHFDYQNQSG